MRETREYRDLSPKAKLVVDHLVSSVIAKMGANGRMLRSKKDWMLVIDPRSSNQTDKAIAGALASGLVFRELSVSTPKGGRPKVPSMASNVCLQTQIVHLGLNLGLNLQSEG